jgi:cell division septum initiation protein DivIVA
VADQNAIDGLFANLPKKSFGGLDPSAVAAAVEKARAEFTLMEGRLAAAELERDQLKAERKAIEDALITAQKAAENTRLEAEAQASEMRREAERQAQETLADAKAQAEQIETEHRQALQDLQIDLERQMMLKHRFADEFRNLLSGYLADLDERYPLSSRAVAHRHEMGATANGSVGTEPQSDPEVQPVQD